MKKFYMFLATAALFIFTSTAAHAVVKIEGRYWFPTLDAEVQSGIGGTNVNLVDDIGINDSEAFGEGRITFEVGSHKIRYAFTPLSWDGQGSSTQSITFGGEVYSASVPITSSLDIDYHRVSYGYDFIDFLSNRLGVIIDIKYFDIATELKTASITQSDTLQAPIPTIGLTAQVGLPLLFSVGGEVSGVTFGDKGYLVDGEVAVNYNPLPLVTLSGGYRLLKLEYEDGVDNAFVELNGPFVLLRAGF
ncbi:MAG: hypothetical protein GY721_03090 [Deltaproteobacteria bacterium]|nr:hypothetical protein [Deltaproteobacteria bacterium]